MLPLSFEQVWGGMDAISGLPSSFDQKMMKTGLQYKWTTIGEHIPVDIFRLIDEFM